MDRWFEQLRAVLHDYYPANQPQDIVGYLRGSKSPEVWRQMRDDRQRHQMLLLGSVPPTEADWAAAGVAARGTTATVFLRDLNGLIVLYAGFMVTRPWGQIYPLTPEALQHYQTGTLDSFRRNLPRRR